MDAELPHILVIDDDDRLRSLLHRYLSENGFRVTGAASAAEARRALESMRFDLLVLDLMMPGEHGLDFAADLRDSSDVPILMLTAMGEQEDRIEGLERGADDYLTKPFDPRELLLRINAVLRRRPDAAAAAAAGAPVEVALGDAVFLADRRELRKGGRTVRLTDVEAALLEALARRPHEVLSRDELIALTGAGGSGRAVDVQVTRLRRKIEDDPRLPRYLQTVRGRGYVLRPDR